MSALLNPSAVRTPLPPVRSNAPPTAPRPPAPRLWTRKEYEHLWRLGFFEGRRAMLIRGVIYEEGPMNGPHAMSLTLVHDWLLRLAIPGHYARSQQPLAVGGNSLPLPDHAVVRGSVRDYPVDHPTPAQTLLVVEVADSSPQFDLTTKAELYVEAGLPEYWVLDVDNRALTVLRSPAPLPPGGFAYQSVAAFQPTDSVAPLAAPNSPVLVSELLP